MSHPPFWPEGLSKVHVVVNVRFQSTLIYPIAETKQCDSYHLVMWFCGVGSSALHGIGVEVAWLSRATVSAFALKICRLLA